MPSAASPCAGRSEERRVGKSVDLGGRRIIKKKKQKTAASPGGARPSRTRREGRVPHHEAVGWRAAAGRDDPGAYRAGRPAPRFFFFQAEDGIRGPLVTGVQTCALPI